MSEIKNKYNLTLDQNIFLAKRNLVDYSTNKKDKI